MATERHLIDERLQQALMGEDDLGKVIRSHLVIESNINALLDLRVEYPQYFTKVRLSFNDRIHLAAALGVMRAELLLPLRKLNKLRNDFAHDPEAELTRRRESEVVGALSEFDREVMNRAYTRAKERHPDIYRGPFEKLKTPNRFMLAINILNGALMHMKFELEKHPPGSVVANN